MGTWVTYEDLDVWQLDITEAQADALIKQAESQAKLAAPCLSGDLTDDQVDALKGILTSAVVRWYEAGSGALGQQSVGPFALTPDTRVRRGAFWPTEIRDLQRICGARNGGRGLPHTIDTGSHRERSLLWLRPDLRFQWE